MRIVHLANHAQTICNGTVNMMVDLACVQARMDQEVVVASSGGGFEPLLRRHGITHIPLQQSRQPWRVPSMIAGFNRLIDRFDPDIVHAHMMTGALISRFGSMRRRFALVTTVHHELQKSASFVRAGDHMVAVSRAVADDLQARGIGPERMSIVLNGSIGAPRLVLRPAARRCGSGIRTSCAWRACIAGRASRTCCMCSRWCASNPCTSASFCRSRISISSATAPTATRWKRSRLIWAPPRPCTSRASSPMRGHISPAQTCSRALAPGSVAALDRRGARGRLRDRGDARGRHPRNAGRRLGRRARTRRRSGAGSGKVALAAHRRPGAPAVRGARYNLQQLSVERVNGEYMAIYQHTLAERDSMRRRQMSLDARRARAADGAV